MLEFDSVCCDLLCSVQEFVALYASKESNLGWAQIELIVSKYLHMLQDPSVGKSVRHAERAAQQATTAANELEELRAQLLKLQTEAQGAAGGAGVQFQPHPNEAKMQQDIKDKEETLKGARAVAADLQKQRVTKEQHLGYCRTMIQTFSTHRTEKDELVASLIPKIDTAEYALSYANSNLVRQHSTTH